MDVNNLTTDFININLKWNFKSIFLYITNQTKLKKLKDTHPDVEREFSAGGFGIRRSGKNFSKLPIDLTFERTVNANAASQKTGINSFTNSISARQRWARSHSISMTVLSSLMDDLGLSPTEDVSCELKQST